MNTTEQISTFNLKVMVRETGIRPHTLRAWERRYGLPQPERTSGGHRLYSQRDIDVVRWLVARQKEGLAISRAVELWFQINSKGEDPLNVAVYQSDEHLFMTETGSNLTDLRQQWIDSCLKFDEFRAERVLTQAFALFPVKLVCVEVIQKGLSQIGDLWYRNAATVQQEHFASALTIQRLDVLLAAAPAPTRIGRILLACPPREEHAIPLLILALLLRYRGWDAVYLGANVPLERFGATIDIVKPDLVVLAAQQLRTAATLLKLARFLRERNTRIAFGGLIFNRISTLDQQIPGHFLGEELENAVRVIEQVITFNSPVTAVKPTSTASEHAARAYLAKRVDIEMDAWRQLEPSGIPREYFADTTNRLFEDIMAALYLDDINYIEVEFDWGAQLFANYGLPMHWTADYLNIYYKAVRKHLNESGRPIIDWLDKTRLSHSITDDPAAIA
jgi:MerR family transcriptional regulator, light-induced transcriptional regulator